MIEKECSKQPSLTSTQLALCKVVITSSDDITTAGQQVFFGIKTIREIIY